MLHRNWIDRLVGQHAAVSVLWTGTMPSPYPVYENEFFNRSVRTVYHDVDGAARPDPLPETDVSLAAERRGCATADGRPVHAQYVLASGNLELAGKQIASDDAGVALYRVNGPIVILPSVVGLYPNETWSGRSVTYQRVECTGGSVDVQLQGDSRLFTRPQTVVAIENGGVVGRKTIPVESPTTMTVPLLPGANGRCVVRFTVGRTLIPAEESSPGRSAPGRSAPTS